VVTCEIETTAEARSLVVSLSLPMSCTVAASGTSVQLYDGGEALAELSDRRLVERLLVCIGRKHTYTAVLRYEHGRLVADINGS